MVADASPAEVQDAGATIYTRKDSEPGIVLRRYSCTAFCMPHRVIRCASLAAIDKTQSVFK
jgi:hypothetical protein